MSLKLLRTCLSLLLAGSLFAQNAPSRPRILGIAHVAIYVSDLNQARAFYKDFLGFAEPFSVHRQNGADWIGFIKMNDQQYVELFAETAGLAGQLNHIALYTDDAAGMRAYLASRGVAIVDELHQGRTGDMFFSVRDPDGNLMEIVQYQTNSWTGQNKGKFLPESRISSHLSDVGVPVASIPIALNFYRDILGFKLITQDTGSGTRPAWVDIRVAEGTDYVQLNVIEGTPAASTWKAASHMGLTVADAEKSLADLQSRTADASYFRSTAVQIGREQKPMAQLSDRDGVRIDLRETGTAAGRAAVVKK